MWAMFACPWCSFSSISKWEKHTMKIYRIWELCIFNYAAVISSITFLSRNYVVFNPSTWISKAITLGVKQGGRIWSSMKRRRNFRNNLEKSRPYGIISLRFCMFYFSCTLSWEKHTTNKYKCLGYPWLMPNILLLNIFLVY